MDKRTARIADKYIGRNGEEPSRTITTKDVADQRVDDITTVASFLAWCQDEMYGARTGKEALEAFARLIDVPVAKLRALNPDC